MNTKLFVIPVLLTFFAAVAINMDPPAESPAKTCEEQQALTYTEEFLRRYSGSDVDLGTCRLSHSPESAEESRQITVEGTLYDDRTFLCCLTLDASTQSAEMERIVISGRQVFPRHLPQFEGTPEDLIRALDGQPALIPAGGRRPFPGGPVQPQQQPPRLE